MQCQQTRIAVIYVQRSSAFPTVCNDNQDLTESLERDMYYCAYSVGVMKRQSNRAKIQKISRYARFFFAIGA